MKKILSWIFFSIWSMMVISVIGYICFAEYQNRANVNFPHVQYIFVMCLSILLGAISGLSWLNRLLGRKTTEAEKNRQAMNKKSIIWSLLAFLFLANFAKAETVYITLNPPYISLVTEPEKITEFLNDWEAEHFMKEIITWNLNLQNTRTASGVWITYKLKPQKTTDVIERKGK